MKKIIVCLFVIAFSAVSVFAQEKNAEPKKVEAKEKTVQEYVADLDNSNENVVIEAEKKLGELKNESSTAKLLQLCKSDKRVKSVRMYAAVALSFIADKKTAEPLSEMVGSEPSSDVRYAQVLAISRIGVDSKKAIDNLMAVKDKETDPLIKDFVVKMEQKFKGQ